MVRCGNCGELVEADEMQEVQDMGYPAGEVCDSCARWFDDPADVDGHQIVPIVRW